MACPAGSSTWARVVDSRREGARDLDEFPAAPFQEVDRGAQLAVGGDLNAEAHHGGVRGKPELLAQRDRVERERVMLGVAAQEHAAVSLPRDRLGAREAHDVPVERLHLRHVVAEKPHRAVADDLEGPGQHDAVHVVFRGQLLGIAESRVEIDAFRPRLPRLPGTRESAAAAGARDIRARAWRAAWRVPSSRFARFRSRARCGALRDRRGSSASWIPACRGRRG